MKRFEQFDIKKFTLRFGGGNTDTDIYKIVYYGPLSYGNLLETSTSLSAKRYKSILILYNGSDDKNNTKELAIKLKKHLDEGLDNKKIFAGFNSIFNLNVEYSLIPFRGEYETQKIEEIYDIFNQHCDNIDTCFPLIILPWESRSIYNNIYYAVKAIFLKKEVPSQIFTIDVLRDKQKYTWSLLPLSIQIFTKMGGIPYIIDRSVLGEVPTDVAVFIMGLGISQHPLQQKRGIGFTTVFDHHGTWYFADSVALILDKKDNISKSLSDLLKRCIQQLLKLSKAKKNVLIIHYSGKEIGRIEEEAIAEAIKDIETDLFKFASVYILKIKNSNFVIGDTNSPYAVDGNVTYYPPAGTIFELKPDIYLMVTSGYFLDSQGRAKGNIKIGLPTVKIVSRHRNMEIRRYDIELDNKQLLATVFGLCRINYNSVQNPILREPITIRYSKEIAWLSLRLLDLNTNLDNIGRIKKIMWFI